MTNETKRSDAGITKHGAVEVRDDALDAASGGAIYMKVDGVKGRVTEDAKPMESLSINFTKIEY